MAAGELLELVKRRIRRSLLHEPWWAEFWCALAAILWGLYVVLTPFDLAQAGLWNPITSIAGDPVWASIAVGCGVVQLSATLVNIRMARWAASLAMMSFWLLVVNSMWLSGYHGPGIMVYAAWVGPPAGSVLRLLRPV